ncbi:L-piperidine-6-carboxylate dehydrogenase [Chitinibacter tainanensis]|uniref:L-piperidine-6-carboxylate dehydrogenase n=1 Tax=Chitinibacter tainanensis TaxID=230667 RepID=UPI0003FB0804|nr:aldehyde dehydrogenase family protein [Chitinibacter tainanensis]
MTALYTLSEVAAELGLADLIRQGRWPAGWVDGLPVYPVLVVGERELSSPIDCASHGRQAYFPPTELPAALNTAQAAFVQWRLRPAPQRGALVRALGEVIRAHKAALAKLIVLETGKIESEALGEVQECIDICDFAVGLSRQLHGLVIASERPEHRLLEQWHPLGVVGVVTAFNFPLAVWAWNSMLALVCGDAVVWKPSEKTPLIALAMQQLAQPVLQAHAAPAGLLQLVQGDALVGGALADSPIVALLSATGSTRMGQALAPRVAARFGRSLLELGGNNALILTPTADWAQALPAIVFSAVGTCGQRCTSLRRLLVPRSILAQVSEALVQVYKTLAIGDPRVAGTLVGPIIDSIALQAMKNKIQQAIQEGGTLLSGGQVVVGVPVGHYVQPALISMPTQTAVVQEETFAPLLYLLPYDTLSEAIALNNAVAQGLSSAIFTRDLREAELFISAAGSDCGLANVNCGTSGAEIGGAFGGEKATGGGRESGSDAWKNYMRRSTNTINYGQSLPLAQGVQFGLGTD